jgi:hypothetical protein
MTKDSELAKLAWSILDATSRDPKYCDQLSPEQWNKLGRFMASVVIMFDDETVVGETTNAHPA